MTVREALENLSTLPLDCDIFIRFNSGEFSYRYNKGL